MSRKISVEVFRDIDTPDADPAIAVAGLDLVNVHTEHALDLVNIDRKMRIARPGDEVVNAAKINWGSSPIDMRLIVTDRPLVTAELAPGEPLGFAQRDPMRGGGVAVISTFKSAALEPHLTASHEIGHLFNLAYGEANSQPHCDDQSCIMAASARSTIDEVRTRRHGVGRWLERRGYLLPEYRAVESRLNREFCSPCTAQLSKRAFFMLKHRNGEHVPESWR